MTASRTPKHSRRSAVYRKAASLIEKRDYDRTCWAINGAGGSMHDKRAYREMYGFEAVHLHNGVDSFTAAIYHACGHESPYPINSDKTFDMRVLLLCFAAAVAERP